MSDQVARSLRDKVFTGALVTGERLPPERELAEAFGVSRHTVRAALTRLENENLVTTRQGSGTVVADFWLTGGLGLLDKMPRAVQEAFLPSLLELRRILAVEAVGLACRRAKPAQVAGLRAIARRIARTREPAAIMELDIEFSRVLFAAAHNPAMILLLNTVEGLYRQRSDLVDALFRDRPEVSASYDALVDLVEHGDADLARAEIRRALEERDAVTVRRYAANGDANPEPAAAGFEARTGRARLSTEP